MIIIIVIDHYW